MRIRRRKRSEKLKDWRAAVPLRSISFRPALTEDKVDAEDVLQVHLEHRLVRRLLSRFLSQGFASGLSRACVVVGPGAQPRVILLGRLALYGPGAARLHEEIILVTAAWKEAERGTTPLKPFGTGEAETQRCLPWRGNGGLCDASPHTAVDVRKSERLKRIADMAGGGPTSSSTL